VKFAVQVSDGVPAYCTVILHFAETEALTPGQRVFDVRIQGKDAAAGLDVAAATGGTDRAWSRQFRDVATTGTLTLELVPVKGKPPVICAIEVLRQQGE
jgi:hypothetical protein